MGLEEAVEEPGFWILAGGGILAEVVGYIVSKRAGLAAFTWWQFLLVVLVTIVAAAYFATKD